MIASCLRSEHRDQKRFHSAAERLEHALKRDVDSGKNKAERDYPHGAYAQPLGLSGQPEQRGERICKDFKHEESCQHNCKRVYKTVFYSVLYPVAVAHAMAEGDYRCDRVSQSKGGKKDELLNFIVQPVCGDDVFPDSHKYNIEQMNNLFKDLVITYIKFSFDYSFYVFDKVAVLFGGYIGADFNLDLRGAEKRYVENRNLSSFDIGFQLGLKIGEGL